MAPALVFERRQWKLCRPVSLNDFVFVDALGRPMSRKVNNRMLKACYERAGIRDLRTNNFRRCFASQHLTAGTSTLEVSKLRGHSTHDVTLKDYFRGAERVVSKAEVALTSRTFGAAERLELTGIE